MANGQRVVEIRRRHILYSYSFRYVIYSIKRARKKNNNDTTRIRRKKKRGIYECVFQPHDHKSRK